MSLSLLSRNYSTHYCIFSVDGADDIPYLPTIKSSGKGQYKCLLSCCQGSIAQSINGEQYILNGNNEWVKYVNKSSGNTNSGGTGNSEDSDSEEDVEPIDNSTIEDLFK
jgi:hypothetical protein